MSEKIYCPFCGTHIESWTDNQQERHVQKCRISRFNEACDAALPILISEQAGPLDPPDEILDDELTRCERVAVYVMDYARALVDAIEASAKEKGEE